MDPFDISREERKLAIGNFKISSIKFPITKPDLKNSLSAEVIGSPKYCEFENSLKDIKNTISGKLGKNFDVEKFEEFLDKLKGLELDANNLREFMTGLIKLLCPELRIIFLEEILSNNVILIKSLINKIQIPVRAICSSCNCFVSINLGEATPCCKIDAEEIISSGRYIPQRGFLPIILFLCGYKVFSNSKEKTEQAKEIMSRLSILGNPLQGYEELDCQTMFEDYLFRKETLLNSNKLIR